MGSPPEPALAQAGAGMTKKKEGLFYLFGKRSRFAASV
jgi:hypothetical protein